MTKPLVIARSGATKQSRSASQVFVKIAPLWVGAINEVDLLLARAGLYLLFARNSVGRIVPGFIVDQLVDIVPFGESGQQLLSMLMNPRAKISSDPSIEHRVAFIGQDVDAVDRIHTGSCLSLRVSHRPAADPPWMKKGGFPRRIIARECPVFLLGAQRRSNLVPN